MKHTNRCPKCAGTELLRIDGDCRAYGAGNNILTGMTIFSAVMVNRYVCCRCGYTEEWIDREDLEKLQEKYQKI